MGNSVMIWLGVCLALGVSAASHLGAPRQALGDHYYPLEPAFEETAHGAQHPPLLHINSYSGSPQYGELGCCRSQFPDEHGSCRTNEHCIHRTQPYCSGYGYCTQTLRYGENGCKDCPKPSF